MPTVTLNTLPLDVLDLVFQFLEDDLSDVERPSRIETFHRLCLVTRTLLPLARRFLYANPVPLGVRDWKSATSLIDTLRQPTGHFGLGVRNLAMLAMSLSRLLSANSNKVKNHSFQVRGQSKAYSWYFAMLEACPQLKVVGVVFSNPQQLNKVLRALSSSLPTLKKLVFQSVTGCRMSSDLVHKFAQRLEVEEVEEMDLKSLDSVRFLTTPKIPFRIRRLAITALEREVAPQFFPTQLSYLRSLTLHSEYGFVDLVRLAAPHLSELTVEAGHAYYTLGFADYARQHTGPLLPSELFSLLPNLQSLKLTSFKGVSVGRISALAATSPRLARLVFTESVWIADDLWSLDTSVQGWQAKVFPQKELLNLFNSFAQLKHLDLGFIPISCHDLGTELEGPLRCKGVEVKYTRPEPYCETCGDYHWW